MRKKPTANKAEKYNEAQQFNKQNQKDKERKKLVSDLYKDKAVPRSRRPSPRGK